MGKFDNYSREKGRKQALGQKKDRRFLSFNYTKRCVVQSQSFEEWKELGLLVDLMTKMTQLSGLTVPQALANGDLKVYTKVEFPPKSGFVWPKHVPDDIKWSTFHIKPKSIEVVAGYLDGDVFYIVFLDKDHLFWKCKLK